MQASLCMAVLLLVYLYQMEKFGRFRYGIGDGGTGVTEEYNLDWFLCEHGEERFHSIGGITLRR